MAITLIEPGWTRPESPFHEGELTVQARVGVADKMDRMGRRFIRDYMTEQHREFFELIPFVFTGLVDSNGQPWASMLVGHPGFMHSADARSLRIDARALPGDPSAAALRDGADIGLLGIELPTRRRNRMNGTVSRLGPEGFSVNVVHSFGNCPQYIQGREHEFIRQPGAVFDVHPTWMTSLDSRAREMIATADTFIIASANREVSAGTAKGADVSHRGGKPGFVRIDDDRTLVAPDFVGNFLFNTLGNLTIDPRAGLLFIDFTKGDLLYVAVRAEIIWDGPEVKAFAGAERIIRFTVANAVRLEGVLPLRWAQPAFSPLIKRTGSWEQVARNLDAVRQRNVWRRFMVSAVRVESATIRTLTLRPHDGGGITPFEPGQHLPMRIPAGPEPVLRTYSLSDAFNGRDYRISVKRQGVASIWLQDARPGTVVEIMAPRGDFVFQLAEERPVVLLSAGSGIAPMMAILKSLLVNDGRTRHHGQIYFIHGARTGADIAFGEELRALASRHSNLRLYVSLSQPAEADALGSTHEHRGRIDVNLVKAILPLDDYDFYLCGPTEFMQTLYDGLRNIRVDDRRIRLESFGTGAVKRQRSLPSSATVEEGIEVRFALSDKSVHWHRSDGSLLELAEANGLSPLHGCRTGTCGACATALTSGDVDYTESPHYGIAPGEALLCCSVPRPGPHKEGSIHREGIVLEV